MPYKIVEQKDKKFKVCKADDKKVCFSKKGIPYKTARKQVRAIVSGESKKGTKKGKGKESEGEETDRSRSSSMSSKMSEMSDHYLEYLRQTRENATISDEEVYDKDQFTEKYNELWDDNDENLSDDEIIAKIIEDQTMYRATDEEMEELIDNFLIADGLDDDQVDQGVQFPDFTGYRFLATSNITNNKTSYNSINYNDFKELYDDILTHCKNNTKDGYWGCMVDTSNLYPSRTPNYRMLNVLKTLFGHIIGRGEYESWCVDKCSGEQWNFDLFAQDTFGVVFKHQGDKLFICAGAELVPRGGHVYIGHLCGQGGGKYIMEAYRRYYKQDGIDVFWPNTFGNQKYDYLDLGSVHNYVTVMFYYKQGLLQPYDEAETSTNDFIELIKDNVADGKFASVKNYADKYYKFFDKKSDMYGYCKSDDHYLNDIFNSCGCGGKKYLFPEIDVKLGVTDTYEEGERMVSYNFLDEFGKVLKDMMKDPKKYDPVLTIDEKRERVIKQIEDKTRTASRRERVKIVEGERDDDGQSGKVITNPNVRRIRPSQIPRDYKDPSKLKYNTGEFVNLERSIDEPRRRYVTQNQPRIGVLNEINRIGRRSVRRSRKNAETTGSGVKGTKFYEELRSYGIKPEDYLKQMKTWAKKSGYDERQLTLDNDDKHKLRIMTENGTKHFGRVGYKDYYIYRHLEKKKEVKKGYAKIMRDRFRKSHGAISKKRKLGRNSANELSLRILWHEEDDEKKK
jgi:hypothetical protein